MKLATAVLATTVVTSSTIVVKAGRFSRHRRLSTYGYGEGEYEMIAGYTPGTQVRRFALSATLMLYGLFVA